MLDESVLLEHHRAALEAQLNELDVSERGEALDGDGDETDADVEREESASERSKQDSAVELGRLPSRERLSLAQRAAVAEHRLCVTVSVLVYWVAVSLVPVWNKRVMHASRFPYAIATAMVQLGTVAAVLWLASVAEHLWLDDLLKGSVLGRRWGRGVDVKKSSSLALSEGRGGKGGGEGSSAQQPLLPTEPASAAFALHYPALHYRDTTVLAERVERAHARSRAGSQEPSRSGSRLQDLTEEGALAEAQAHALANQMLVNHKSWVLGPHLCYKLKTVAPIGFLFGLKYSVTNLGLMLLPTSTHLLLQGTDILWTVAAAALINRERIGRFELAACALCFFGSTLLSLRVGATLSAPLPALLINLSSPMLLGLCIATLRKATVELMRADGPLKGTMSHGELTCFKLLLSTLTAAVGALLVEGVFVQTFHDLHARADGPLHGSGGGSMAPVHGLVAVNASLNSLNTSLSSLTALPLLQRHLPLVRNASVAAMAKATVAAVAGLANGSALNDGPSAHGRNGDGDGDGEDGGAGVGGAGGGAGGVGEKLSTDTKPTDTKPVETKPVDSKPPFWTALVRLPRVELLGLLGGSLLVLVFQVNITWLTHLTSAVSVGLVGGVKIVPQWGLALLVEHRLDASLVNLVGALLMIVAGALFSYGRSQRPPRVRVQHEPAAAQVRRAGSL